MSTDVRIEITPQNSRDIQDLLMNDPGIRGLLQQKADKVAAQAGPGHKGEVFTGFDRQRGMVRTTTVAAARDEADNHTLLKALDAARD